MLVLPEASHKPSSLLPGSQADNLSHALLQVGALISPVVVELLLCVCCMR